MPTRDAIESFLERHSLPSDARDDLQTLLQTEAARLIRGPDHPTSIPTWEPTHGAEAEAHLLPTRVAALSDLDLTTGGLPAAPDPFPGLYTDQGVLGVGGMGEVRRLFDRRLRRTVAGKFLKADHADSAAAIARFVGEAQVTAQLQHPGVVPVHTLGRHPDGRLFFTMKEIRGRTLAQATQAVHRASGNGSWGTDGGWSLRRLLDAFRMVCETLAYAHARGVVHRDVKPTNIMVGDFGEVSVVDWGLARIVGEVSEPTAEGVARSGEVTTRAGAVAGTPPYMAPEQALGGFARLGPTADVYALGAVLYQILAGVPPYGGRTWEENLRAIKEGPPEPLAARVAARGLPVSEELVAVCDRAMARETEDRYADASGLAEAMRAWLEGDLQRDRALALVEHARALLPEVDRKRRLSVALLREADLVLGGVQPWEPVERKQEAWERQERAARLAEEADLAEVRYVHLLQGALTHHREVREAHTLLADHYRREHARAEGQRRWRDAKKLEVQLSAHDLGAHARYLRGIGALSLITDPPGATVELFAYVDRHRRMVPESMGVVGHTPLLAYELPIGSYLLVITAPGHQPVRYPVYIEREQHWDGVPTGAAEAEPIWLPRVGDLDGDAVYVPAGRVELGGDPHAAQAAPASSQWVPGFVIRRFPVTNREYLAVLNNLVADGRAEMADALAPRERGAGEGYVYGRGADGGFHLQPDVDGDCWEPDWPVLLVSWEQARIYADHVGWRLPCEREWEKAARGVDGRVYPWGNGFDPTWCCIAESREGRSLPAAVHEFPHDTSPYGMRGAAGGACDWCADAEDDSDNPRRAVRGGAWSFFRGASRVAWRDWVRPEMRMHALGFRLAREIVRSDSATPR